MGTSRRIGREVGASIVASVLAFALATAPATAQRADDDARPYDSKLIRLAEILGAVHYLRELCGANEGQRWRERMQELLEGEGTSPLRKAKLANSFNNGYRSYSRTYQSCTPSAQTAISRFLAEGAQLSEALLKSTP